MATGLSFNMIAYYMRNGRRYMTDFYLSELALHDDNVAFYLEYRELIEADSIEIMPLSRQSLPWVPIMPPTLPEHIPVDENPANYFEIEVDFGPEGADISQSHNMSPAPTQHDDENMDPQSIPRTTPGLLYTVPVEGGDSETLIELIPYNTSLQPTEFCGDEETIPQFGGANDDR